MASSQLMSCPSRQIFVVRPAKQQCDQPRCARAELAFAIERRRPLAVKHALELRQPAIERREVRPLVVVARHDRAHRQRFTAQITGLAKCFVCVFDGWAPTLRLDEDPRATEPVFEPGIVLAHACRQRFDPVG